MNTTPDVTTEGSKRIPLELWRMIFEQARDQDTAGSLISTARLCKTLQLEAEAVLYGTVELQNVSQLQHLAEALQSSPRRTDMVRNLSVILNRHHWPSVQEADYWLPILAPESIQRVNTLLKMTVRLESLAVQRGTGGMDPGPAEKMLEGCTFQLRTFITDFSIDDDGHFFNVLAQQPSIEEMTISPTRMTYPPVIPANILPKLRKLCADKHFVHGLQAPHSITHLKLAYDDESTIDFVLKLLGHQLVSLSLCRVSMRLTGSALSFTDSHTIDLPCLTRISTRTNSEESSNIMQHKPLNLKTFRPPKGPIKTWIWCTGTSCPPQDKDNAVRRKYNTSVTWFAGQILKAWPSLETFEFVRLDDYSTSTIYSLDTNNQLVEREQRFTHRLTWDMY